MSTGQTAGRNHASSSHPDIGDTLGDPPAKYRVLFTTCSLAVLV